MKNRIDMIDLHMHSTISDGTDTPSELLAHVREAGIELFALTDHDAIKGYGMIRDALGADDPKQISGVEFSCRDALGKYHILGYNYDPDGALIRGVVDKGHALRMEKVAARLAFLESEFGFSFPESEIEALLALDNPGKPHIGNLMVQHGYAATKEIAIHEYIDKANIKSEYIGPEEAIQAILGSGGIPVLAHPAYGSGEELIVGEALDARLNRLIGFGLQGVEVFYSGFTPKLRLQMLFLAEKYDLYVTAGSDYHGTNKLVVLGDTGLRHAVILPPGVKRFLEAVGAASD